MSAAILPAIPVLYPAIPVLYPAIPVLYPAIPVLYPAIPVLYPRHSRLLPPSFPRKRESRRLQSGKPSEIKYELKPADPFSLYGRRLG